MNRIYIKKFLPKRLLPRLLLIFLVPLIIIQCSVIFFFYDRHWEKIINRFSNIASNKINLIHNEYKRTNLNNVKNLASQLNISVFIVSDVPIIFKNKSKLEKKIQQTIRSRVGKDIKINFLKEFVSFYLPIENNFIRINFPRKYLLSETPIIYILWIISTSLILSLIALLFLRIQIRAIYRLAKSAEDFGEGKKKVDFKPEGAMEIRAAGNAFLKMKKRINNYIDQKTNFLIGISHDLGTIITRIKLRLELLENKKETIQIKKDVETMQVFLKEYLDYSKEINVKKYEKINLAQLINLVIESYKLKNKKIKIKCQKTLFINTDRNSLYRIIFNLFENATRFGSEVEITVKKNLKNIIIDIEDNGPGIGVEYKKKVFNPFYKIDNSRNLNESGSGLGLSIARELSKSIKAKINLKNSKRLKGCMFSISIPLKN